MIVPGRFRSKKFQMSIHDWGLACRSKNDTLSSWVSVLLQERYAYNLALTRVKIYRSVITKNYITIDFDIFLLYNYWYMIVFTITTSLYIDIFSAILAAPSKCTILGFFFGHLRWSQMCRKVSNKDALWPLDFVDSN